MDQRYSPILPCPSIVENGLFWHGHLGLETTMNKKQTVTALQISTGALIASLALIGSGCAPGANETRAAAPKSSLGLSATQKSGSGPLARVDDLSNKAHTEIAKGSYATAELDLKEVIRRDPRNPGRYLTLAKLYDLEGRSQDAYDAWTHVVTKAHGFVSTASSDPAVLTHYGELCEKLGHHAKAEEAFSL